jgi:hypothetical protein
MLNLNCNTNSNSSILNSSVSHSLCTSKSSVTASNSRDSGNMDIGCVDFHDNTPFSTGVSHQKRVAKKNPCSEVWQYFDVFTDRKYKSYAFCKLCQPEVYFTPTMSTGMLTCHIQKHHHEEHEKVIEAQITEQGKLCLGEVSQLSVTKFTVYCFIIIIIFYYFIYYYNYYYFS